jgi:hypothetical protein
MQKFDGSNDGKFDGSPPDPHTEPSWRGVFLMLLIIVGFLVLVAWAFVAIGWSLPALPIAGRAHARIITRIILIRVSALTACG